MLVDSYGTLKGAAFADIPKGQTITPGTGTVPPVKMGDLDSITVNAANSNYNGKTVYGMLGGKVLYEDGGNYKLGDPNGPNAGDAPYTFDAKNLPTLPTAYYIDYLGKR